MKPDSGQTEFDAGNPVAMDGCSGGCAANQICDTTRRTCVDACGGCDAGICAKVGSMTYQCVVPSVTCGGSVCEAGQLACLGGSCSCLASSTGLTDSCSSQGKWCNGSACANPTKYQQCYAGGAACPTSYKCTELFRNTSVCIHTCGTAGGNCDKGEACAGGTGSISNVCLPLSFFANSDCQQNVRLPAIDGGADAGLIDAGFQLGTDGGISFISVPAGNTCLLTTTTGGINDEPGPGTGNCTNINFYTFTYGLLPIATCRAPGTATEGQLCKNNYSAGTTAQQCSTGLECVITTGDQGVCMRMCNANPPKPGFTPQPACSGAGEVCANLYRYTDPDDNSVVGVCMKGCNAFDPAKNTCPNIGTAAASCVPVTADGQLPVSTDGTGLCSPQRQTIAALNAPCTETDAFKGAACASGQICAPTADNAQTLCTAVCDLDCAVATGAPARCNTEPNAKCAAGKTCTRVTTGHGVLGFCR